MNTNKGTIREQIQELLYQLEYINNQKYTVPNLDKIDDTVYEIIELTKKVRKCIKE